MERRLGDLRRPLEIPFPEDPAVAQEVRLLLEADAAIQEALRAPGTAGEPGPAPGRVLRLGRFELGRKLGEGAFGTVFLAWDAQFERQVAIKWFHTRPPGDRSAEGLFHQEIRAVGALRHPNIVPVFEATEEPGHPYFAMAYVPGGTWRDRAREFSLRDRVRILGLIARALGYAHSRGILHEDIKPSNILLDLDATPFLSDFGLAHEFPIQLGREDLGGGTLDYMAPERLPTGRPASGPSADIFSLGVVLYESVFGRRPFEGRNPQDVRSAILERKLSQPRPGAPGVNRDLAAICFQALAADPRDRYATGEDMAEDLSRWLSHAEVKARPRGIPEKILRWLVRR